MKRKTEAAIKEAEDLAKTDDDIDIEFVNGLQIYKNELESKLTFMQKLQLRIAEERKISIQKLKGDEFQILKDFKKLEERKELLNTVNDFFDPKYDFVTPKISGVHSSQRMVMENESAHHIMSDHGEQAIYSNDSQHHDSRKEHRFM